MADALKEMFNAAYYKELSTSLNKAYKQFDSDRFIKEVTKDLEHKSLNERLRNTSQVLKKYLPADYKKSVTILITAIPNLRSGYTTLVFPDFVGLYGQDNFATSMEALKTFTSYGSSEFAIREFLKRDFNKTIKVMEQWAEDKNHHVRRLASEGSRPRLPWSFKLDMVIKNPEVTLPILEKLKTDNELYVKKSVANHLNDISKDNTAWMLKVLGTWDTSNPHTQWIVKHASRTLIKKGNSESLSLFNFEKNVKIKIENFKLSKTKIKLGESLVFEFDVISEKKSIQKLAIDYAIHYSKKNGELSPKVFKLKELELQPKQTIRIQKKQLFKNFTTRKHYKGRHLLELLINGKSYGIIAFELLT